MKSITCDFCGIESKDSSGWVLAKKDLCPVCVVELREALGETLNINRPGQHIALSKPLPTGFGHSPLGPRLHMPMPAEKNPLLETDFGQGVMSSGDGIGRNFVAELDNLRASNAEKRRRN